MDDPTRTAPNGLAAPSEARRLRKSQYNEKVRFKEVVRMAGAHESEHSFFLGIRCALEGRPLLLGSTTPSHAVIGHELQHLWFNQRWAFACTFACDISQRGTHATR